MKRFIAFSLCFVLLFSLVACTPGATAVQKPVSFYYMAANSDKQTPDSLIQPELRESAGYENSPEKLFNLYLKGPADPQFSTPFPNDTRVISMTRVLDTLYLHLNRISQLSGFRLLIACACLTLTAESITGAKEVVISSESGDMDGMSQITMNANSIHLSDFSANYPSEPATLPPSDTETTSAKGGADQ